MSLYTIAGTHKMHGSTSFMGSLCNYWLSLIQALQVFKHISSLSKCNYDGCGCINFVVMCHVIGYTRPSTTLTKRRPGDEAMIYSCDPVLLGLKNYSTGHRQRQNETCSNMFAAQLKCICIHHAQVTVWGTVKRSSRIYTKSKAAACQPTSPQ